MKWWEWVGLGVVLDQISKIFILNYYPQFISFNQGISFGLLPGRGWAVFNLIILLLLIGFFKKNLAILLILAGGISNLIDRGLRERVIDFINLKIPYFPVFNLADIFICLGAGLLAVSLVLNIKKD